jgi:hypothetical protein
MARSRLNAALALIAFSFARPGAPSFAACTDKVRTFLEEWRRVHPEEAAEVSKSAESAEARLADFKRGGEGPTYSGAEGSIHTSPLSPDRALKIWFPHRLADFRDGVDFLIVTRKTVEKIPEMAQKLKVVRVLERGDGWIVREFFQESRPLADVLESEPAAKQALNETVKLANRYQSKGPMMQRLQRMLMAKPPSVNLHWDAVTQQIVLIDGF